MKKGAVLVIASDAAIGALLGALADVSGYRAVAPAPPETAADAIARCRPSVVLLDADDDRSAEARVYRLAAELGSCVVMFSSSRGREETERMAARRGVCALPLPIGQRDFARAMACAAGGVAKDAKGAPPAPMTAALR